MGIEKIIVLAPTARGKKASVQLVGQQSFIRMDVEGPFGTDKMQVRLSPLEIHSQPRLYLLVSLTENQMFL